MVCFGGAVNRANWATAGSVAGAAVGGLAPDGFTQAAVLAGDCLTGAAGADTGFGAVMPTGGDSGGGENVTTRS